MEMSRKRFFSETQLHGCIYGPVPKWQAGPFHGNPWTRNQQGKVKFSVENDEWRNEMNQPSYVRQGVRFSFEYVKTNT